MAAGVNAGISCGAVNIASSKFAYIGGSLWNTASGQYSGILDGTRNVASADYAFVGAGDQNVASGPFACVVGGQLNTAMGNYSFAGGLRANAAHNGTFVWADSTTATLFASTAVNQFLIKAAGGVGINKNNPSSSLDVAGTVQATGLKLPTGATPGYVLTSDASGNGTWQPAGGGGLTRPYAGSVAYPGPAFSITNTADGGNAIVATITNSQGLGGAALVANVQSGGPALIANVISGSPAVEVNMAGGGGAGVVAQVQGGGAGLVGVSYDGGSGAVAVAYQGAPALVATDYGPGGALEATDQTSGAYVSLARGSKGVYCSGDFEMLNGTFTASPTSTTWTTNKPATVKLEDGTRVKLFAEEPTEVYFSDYGDGQLAGGRAHITLDAAFLQTVTINERFPMKVFVQLEGDCNGVFVTNKTTTGFDVVELAGGRSDAAFSYRAVCTRRHYDGERLATDEQDREYKARMLQEVWPERSSQGILPVERTRTTNAFSEN